MTIHPFRAVWPTIHQDVFVAPSADVIGDVEIGEGSSIWFGSVLRGDVFPIRLGRRVNVQDNSVIHVTTGKHATIVHDDVTIGHRVILHGATVEPGCLIGMGAIVMDRAVIGAGSLVGAGALVVEGTIVPPGSLVVGAPAKVKRPLTPEEQANVRASAAQYAELARVYSAELGTGHRPR